MSLEPRGRREFVRDALAILAAAAGAPRELGGEVAAPSPMLSRPIPRSGEQLPVVGVGTWQTFDPPEQTPAVLAELEATLRVLVDAGGRVIDSSPMYGQSQRVAGTLSEKLGINSTLFVATKVWTSGEQAGIAQMNASMRELQRTKIDLMQVHNLVDWRTHLATLRRWKEEGRIRYLGVTHYQASAFDELERIVTRERIDFVQLPYSVGYRGAERRLLPAAASAGVAVLVNRPFEGGSLFRNALGTALPESVRAWAASWPQAFLKFVLAHPAVTCVIPGTGNPRHMRDNVQAGVGRLPTEREREELVRALPA